MISMRHLLLSVTLAGVSMLGLHPALADDDRALDNKQACPVSSYNGVTTMDEEFGYGTQEATHCLRVRKNAKVVVSVDYTHPLDPLGLVQTNRATYLSNIDKMVTNYEVVHGMKIGKDVDIVVVFSQSGGALATLQHPIFARSNPGNPTNPFKQLVEYGLQKGIKFYLCQEASRALGIKKPNVIEGVQFVPGGHIAVADFQLRGYALIRP